MLKGFLTESYYITLICPEVDGRGRHGVGKARDGHQRSGSAEPGQLVIQVQPREQGRQKHQAHGGGGGGIVLGQQHQPAVQNQLSDNADGPADGEGQGHVLQQGGLFLQIFHIILVFPG